MPMMKQINTSTTQFKLKSDNLNRNTEEILQDDYVDLMINQLQSIALPNYAASQKMVDPPIIAIRFGNAVFCKGVVIASVPYKFGKRINHCENIRFIFYHRYRRIVTFKFP